MCRYFGKFLMMHKRTSTSVAEAVKRGAAAGIVGAIVITVAARAVPWFKPAQASKRVRTKLPPDSFQHAKVAEWQDRSRSPAAYPVLEKGQGGMSRTAVEESAAFTPAAALTEHTSPGAEGSAELFFVKVGSGLFDRDVSKYAKAGGKAVHFIYGAFGGVLYGLAKGRQRWNPWIAGVLYGVFLWGIGPAWLVPAMHLMPPPTRVPKRQEALVILGHAIYGVTVAQVSASLKRVKL